jgi:hypothetical protein
VPYSAVNAGGNCGASAKFGAVYQRANSQGIEGWSDFEQEEPRNQPGTEFL